MTCGLICRGGNFAVLKKVECVASVTDNFGIFTLRHFYVNDTSDTLYAEFIFPVTDGVSVIHFSAETGNRVFSSEIVRKQKSNSVSYGGSRFSADIGAILPGEKIFIETKYTKQIHFDYERARIVIPTLVDKKYVSFGNQLAFDDFTTSPFEVNIDLTYYNAGITNIASPTHRIFSNISGNKATCKITNQLTSEGDVVIDIYVLESEKPKIFRYNDYLTCSFVPKTSQYNRRKHDYLFMFDITDSNKGWKAQQVKTALQLCIRGLQRGDRFNVVFLKKNPKFLSDEFLPVTDEMIKVFSEWLDQIDFSKEAYFYQAISDVYALREKCIAVLVSDGGVNGNSDVLKFIKNQGGITFYTFSIADSANEEFLNKLAHLTGGNLRRIGISDRIDDTIIKTFNKISSPVMMKVGFAFNEAVEDVVPRAIWSVQYGDPITISGRIKGKMPTILKVKGNLLDKDEIFDIPFNNIIDVGEELKYCYIQSLTESLSDGLNFDGSTRDEITLDKITKICITNQVFSKYVSYALSDNQRISKQYINIDLLSNYSAGWYKSDDKLARGYLKRFKIEEHFINLALTQSANGSFRPKYMIEEKDVALYTSEVISDYMENCPNIDYYIWQLRKAVIYLLGHIEATAYSEIPIEIVSAITAWHGVFGENDKISQKAAALAFLTKQNL